jgi:hypothetical protein
MQRGAAASNKNFLLASAPACLPLGGVNSLTQRDSRLPLFQPSCARPKVGTRETRMVRMTRIDANGAPCSDTVSHSNNQKDFLVRSARRISRRVRSQCAVNLQFSAFTLVPTVPRGTLLERQHVLDTRHREPLGRIAALERAHHSAAAPMLRAIDEEPSQLANVLVLERERAQRIAGE